MRKMLKQIIRAMFNSQKCECGRTARYDGCCFDCRGKLGENHER